MLDTSSELPSDAPTKTYEQIRAARVAALLASNRAKRFGANSPKNRARRRTEAGRGKLAELRASKRSQLVDSVSAALVSTNSASTSSSTTSGASSPAMQ